MQLIPIIDGIRDQYVRYSLDQAAKRIAQAHREGKGWDCRIATTGEGYRPLNEQETQTLVKAVTKLLRDNS